MSVDTRNGSGRNGSGDVAQRARLARILADPAGYFAEARRSARDEARREVAARLRSPQPYPAR